MIKPASAKPGSTVQVSLAAAAMRGRAVAGVAEGGSGCFCIPRYGEFPGALASHGNASHRIASKPLRRTKDSSLSVAPVGRLVPRSILLM
jgi:hypothetical protein